MGFEWDAEKERRNVELHGIDFAIALAIFDGQGVTTRSDRGGEHRWSFTGVHEGKLGTIIYTIRGTNHRIISARRAGRNEKREYH